ncbi:MAG: serine hydrolase [Gaiellales bacterium]
MALALTVDAPRPFEANPGIVAFRATQPVDAIAVRVDGRQYRLVPLPKPTRRATIGPLGLPSRDLHLTVIAYANGRAIGRVTTANVLGLPKSAATTVPTTITPPMAQRRMQRLSRPAGSAAAWAINLATGRGASWNAGARFTAASTAKLPIMITYLIRLRRDPVGAREWGTLQSMIRASSNDAANEMLKAVGDGSVDTGGARVTATAHRLGAVRTDEAGGYLPNQDRHGTAPPVRVDDQPQLKCCKVVTAHDLGLLMEEIVQAAHGAGRAHALGLTQRDARVALWLLAHTDYPGLFKPWSRWVVAHKIGYIDVVWHDVAAVFEPSGTLITVALSENQGGVSEGSAASYAHGVLQVAQTGLDEPERTVPRRSVRSAG